MAEEATIYGKGARMSDPRLSLMLFPFHGQLNDGSMKARVLAQKLLAAGVTGLEPMPPLGGSQPNWWNELYLAAKDLDMACSCVDVYADLVGEEKAQRRKALDLVAWGVEWCVKHKSPLALLAGSKPADGMTNEDGRKILAESLAKAAERAEGSGVVLTIEDFGMSPAFTCSVAHIKEVLDISRRGDLRVTFDNGNFLFADERPTDAFVSFRELTAHVHLKDFTPGAPGQPGGLDALSGCCYVGCAIGTGRAEVAECVTILKASGYDGWLSLEVGITPALEETFQAAAYVTGAWQRT